MGTAPDYAYVSAAEHVRPSGVLAYPPRDTLGGLMGTPAHELLTRIEAAEYLRVGLSTMGKLLRDRAIYSVRVGHQIRVPLPALEAYVEGRPYGPRSDLDTPDTTTWPPTPSLFTDDSTPAVDAAAEAEANVRARLLHTQDNPDDLQV